MAKTNKIARFVKGPRGLEYTPNRGPQTKPSGLYLLQLRSHHAGVQSPAPKRRLVVTIDLRDNPDGAPKPIKIVHA